MSETQPQSQRETVVVAMSGGVDSCAAALLLCDQGYSVVGVSMQVWDYRKNGGNAGRATCCAPSDFEDAREIADSRGFPFYVFDFEDSFYDTVIKPFVRAYVDGKTPNPCLDCNRKVKFHQLRRRAEQFGAVKVATGHYAQIREKNSGRLGLFTARDAAKDQSYFLYELSQNDLRTTLFPVGAMTKPEVRELLRERDFHIASKGESQDICFVGSTVPEFIEQETGQPPAPGRIVDSEGKVLGEHGGIYRFTVGQRRGLRVSSAEPMYVLDINPAENLVTIGRKEELASEGFLVEGVNWIDGETPGGTVRSLVKLRYRHPGVLCDVTPRSPNTAEVRFVDEWTAVSPGQAAVFYAPEAETDGSREVFGGGRIEKLGRSRSQ